MPSPTPHTRLSMALLAWLVTAPSTHAQPAGGLRPFTAEEKRGLVEKVVGTDKIVALAKGQRMRALSVVPEQVDKDGVPTFVASIVLVNYVSGQAVRVAIDPATGVVRAVEPLKGRPQSSPEERQEGADLVTKAPELATAISAQTRIQGGFVVDAPDGQPSQGRYLEFHVVTADGRTFIAEAIVDLARGQVVAVRRQEAGRGGAR